MKKGKEGEGSARRTEERIEEEGGGRRDKGEVEERAYQVQRE
jgi:hypothetical protein